MLKTMFFGLGVALQVLVMGELLFLALATLFAMQTGAHVFRYAQF